MQFGTRIWKRKNQKCFESDYFDSAKDVAHKWCLTQKKRLDCIYKNLSQEINEKILDQCRENLDHAVQSRIDLDTDLTNLISTIEEIVELTGMNRRFKENSANKPINTEEAHK